MDSRTMVPVMKKCSVVLQHNADNLGFLPSPSVHALCSTPCFLTKRIPNIISNPDGITLHSQGYFQSLEALSPLLYRGYPLSR